jgi:hypothetical protein
MESASLYEQFDWSKGGIYDTTRNIKVGMTQVSAYCCPSDPQNNLLDVGTSALFTSPPSPGGRILWWKCNVAGVADSRSFDSDSSTDPKYWHGQWDSMGNGAMAASVGSKVIRIADITDGTSNTFAAGEITGASPGPPTPSSKPDYAVYGGTPWVHYNLSSTYYGINGPKTMPRDGTWNPDRETTGFSSYHPGGCNFMMSDASVHFVSENINASELAALATRAGGEPAASNF